MVSLRTFGMVSLRTFGSVSEWFKVPALKAGVRDERTVGSNPTASAKSSNAHVPLPFTKRAKGNWRSDVSSSLTVRSISSGVLAERSIAAGC